MLSFMARGLGQSFHQQRGGDRHRGFAALLTLVAGVSVMTLVSSTGLADAEYWGGQWAYNGGVSFNLNYANTMQPGTQYYAGGDTGASNWNYSSTPASYTKVDYSQPHSVTERGYLSNSDYKLGYTTIDELYCASGGCNIFATNAQDCTNPCQQPPLINNNGQWVTYADSVHFLNRGGKGGGCGTDQKCWNATATHELGHGLGLDHPVNTGCHSVMEFWLNDQYSSDVPTGFDLWSMDRTGMYSGYWSVPYQCG